MEQGRVLGWGIGCSGRVLSGALWVSGEPFRVFFACVANSGRSQMAEAFAREFGGGSVVAASGGSDPAGEVLGSVRTVMAEVGVSMLSFESTGIDEGWVRMADAVVTMGCGEDACPAFGEVELVRWDLADPRGRSLGEVREIRDEVARRVRGLLRERGVLDEGASWGEG